MPLPRKDHKEVAAFLSLFFKHCFSQRCGSTIVTLPQVPRVTNVVEKVEVDAARVRPMIAWFCSRPSVKDLCLLTLHTRKPLVICHALFVADLPEAIHSTSFKKCLTL